MIHRICWFIFRATPAEVAHAFRIRFRYPKGVEGIVLPEKPE